SGTSSYFGVATVASAASVTLASGTSASDLFNVGDATHSISGPVGSTIHVTGSGAVSLVSSNNSFAGDWILDSGTLRIGNANSLGTGANAVTVNAGALEINGATLTRNVTLNK